MTPDGLKPANGLINRPNLTSANTGVVVSATPERTALRDADAPPPPAQKSSGGLALLVAGCSLAAAALVVLAANGEEDDLENESGPSVDVPIEATRGATVSSRMGRSGIPQLDVEAMLDED